MIVIGRLRTATWERDGQTYERLELDAVTVGPDLRRGSTMFHKNPKPVRPDEETGEVVDPETGEVRESGEVPETPDAELHEELEQLAASRT